MLKEIRCDKFIENGLVREPIKFHNGLNSVVGSSDGANSIGKSTFLMIIDFIFGGSDYVTQATDVIDNVGNHTIKFQFEFNDKSFYFSRSTENSAIISICDEKYRIIEELSKDNYCKLIADYYGLDSQTISFRQVISPFIRVWGRDNLDKSKPLKASKDSPDSQGIVTLLKLFNKFAEIKEQADAYKEAEDRKKAFVSASKFDYIVTVKNETAYKANEKRIAELDLEVKQLLKENNKGLVDLSSMQAQQLSDLRLQLSNVRRQKNMLITQKKNFEAERDPSRVQFQKDFESLQNFFPEVDIKKLAEIEQFHKQLASVLKSEFTESSKNLQSMIELATMHINDLEKKISEISDIPNVSQAILERYAIVQREMDLLRNSNMNFKTKNELQNMASNLKEAYDSLVKEIFSVLQDAIDIEMKKINDHIYQGIKSAPKLTIESAKRYEFYTPQDRGTGSEYKGLIVFDLAILAKTPLPILVHDSVLLKQIQDKALEEILNLYSNQSKQIFIALDKEETYSNLSQELLRKSEILRLYPNGGELFGWAWNEQKKEKAND